MPSGKNRGFFNIKKFATTLRELTEGLPTGAEKASIMQQFEEIIAFLGQIQHALGALPGREDTEGVRKAIQALDELAVRAATNPFLASATGLPPRRSSRPKTTPMTEEDRARAQALLDELQSLPIDGMNARIAHEEQVSFRDLNALAFLVGLRTGQHTSRETLVHQIVTKISNFRGYQDLRQAGTD